jgi:hypothetical protein
MMVFEDVQGQQCKGVESARAIALRHAPDYPVWLSGRTTFIHDPRLHTNLQKRSRNLRSPGAADIKQLFPALVRYTICSAIARNNMGSSLERTLTR